MTDDADATPATPDPDDHVAHLRAQIDGAKACGERGDEIVCVAGRRQRSGDAVGGDVLRALDHGALQAGL
jgi:hypothetical protein